MSSARAVRLVLLHPPLRCPLGAATPDYVDARRGHNPPLGLLYLQAAVEQTRHQAVFLDANLEGLSHEEAARQALACEPDLVGVQAMTFTLRDALLTARAIKGLRPETKIIMGGPHPTLYPAETAALAGVDYALAGEGERALVAFLDRFFDEEACATVPGIACLRDGRARLTPAVGLLDDLDSLAPPARRSSPYRRYSSILARRTPNTIMVTSRGCPFSCVFCNRMGRRYRWHSPDYVLREIDDIVALGIREVFIHDDTFTIQRGRIEAICRGLIARRHDLIWEARTRVDCVDEELLALMRAAGCHRLSFGVESGSERVLRSMRKEIDLAQALRVFDRCRKEGIITLADFMIGNLDEEHEDVNKTLDLMRRLDPDYVQFSVCSPYPATPLYAMAIERGLVPRDVWLDYARDPLQEFRSPVWTQNFGEEELGRMVKRAYRSFYLRPRFIARQLFRIRSPAQLAALSRAALGLLQGHK